MAFEKLGDVAFNLANKVRDMETENELMKAALIAISKAVESNTAGSSRSTFTAIKQVIDTINQRN